MSPAACLISIYLLYVFVQFIGNVKKMCLVSYFQPVSQALWEWVDTSRMEYRGMDCCDGSGLEIFESDTNNIELGEGFFS